MTKKTTYYIPQMDCPEEIKMIQGRLKSVSGIQQLEFNLIQQEITITHALSDLSEVESAIISLGMKPTIQSSDQLITQPTHLENAVSMELDDNYYCRYFCDDSGGDRIYLS
jgi:copper chaperone CopZ